MNIYLLRTQANRFQNLIPTMVNELRVIDTLQRFNGIKIGSSYIPLEVEIEDEDPATGGELGDFPSLIAHIPVFSEKAANLLKKDLLLHGEILPLRGARGFYYAYNVTKIVDALIINKCDVIKFPDGRIMDIKKYVFDPKKLSSVCIFKVPEMLLSDVYVTDVFKQEVETHNLRGFDFRCIFSC